MRPDFQILADDVDVTAAIKSRLVSLSVSDSAGMDSDTVEIVLDDRDGKIELPKTGAGLDVRMGYRETSLAKMGLFVVDELLLSGAPATMTIRGHAADLREGLKKPRVRSWHGFTMESIMSTIAAEHGYTSLCADGLASESIEHIDQTDESDLHFLTRLAEDRGAVSKPANGKLLFVPKGEEKSVTGKDLPSVSLMGTDAGSYEATIAERGKYLSVTAKWQDTASAEERTVTAGSGEPMYTIGRRYPDQQSAETAAKAKLAAFARGAATLRVTCPGRTDLMAEGKLTVSGIRSGVDGDWTMSRVTHRIDRGGYACEIEAETTASASEE